MAAMAKASETNKRSANDALDSAVIAVSPISGHALTRADARKGGLARVEQRRQAKEEARLTAEQRLARAMDAKLERLIEAVLAKVEMDGDVAAFRAAWDRAYGAPAQRTEVDDLNATRDIPDNAVLEALQIRDQLAAKRAEKKAASG